MKLAVGKTNGVIINKNGDMVGLQMTPKALQKYTKDTPVGSITAVKRKK